MQQDRPREEALGESHQQEQERRDREERERRRERDRGHKESDAGRREDEDRQRQRRQAWADQIQTNNNNEANGTENTNPAPRDPAPAPRSEPTWVTSGEVEAISEVITLCSAGGGAEQFDPDEPGLEVVRAAPVAAPMFNLDQSFDLDESRVFDCRDLVSSAIEIHRGNQVRTRNIVQFVLLARRRDDGEDDTQSMLEVSSESSQANTTRDERNGGQNGDGRGEGQSSKTDSNNNRARPGDVNNSSPTTAWMVPEPMIFHDVINRVECEMATRKLPCLKAQKWANLWGRVGLIGLSAKNPEDIKQFRDVIEGLEDPQRRYTIFPRDAVDKRGSISVLLRETFRAMDPLCLPQILFARNRGLGGSLKVTHIKSYKNGETTRAGLSKQHWRLVLLQGCASFMKSLENFEEDHKFHVGSGHVYISGGARRPRSERPRPRSTTSTGPPRGGGRGRGLQSHHHDDSFPRLQSGLGRGRGARHSEGDNNQSRRESRPGTSRRMDPPPRRP